MIEFFLNLSSGCSGTVADSIQPGPVTITGGQISAVDPDGINPVEFSVKSGGEFFFFEEPEGIVFSAIFEEFIKEKSSKSEMSKMSSFWFRKLISPGTRG